MIRIYMIIFAERFYNRLLFTQLNDLNFTITVKSDIFLTTRMD